MRIESYFQEIQQAIESCASCRISNITFEKRSTHTGLIIAELMFLNESILRIREFVDVESSVDRLMYAYQYTDSSDKLIFRYDNTGHHKKLNLQTYPHHKHEGREDNVIAASPASLSDILDEIDMMILE